MENVVTSPDGEFEGGAILIQDNIDYRSDERCTIGYDDYSQEEKHNLLLQQQCNPRLSYLDVGQIRKPCRGHYFKRNSLIVPQQHIPSLCAFASKTTMACMDCMRTNSVQKMRGETVEVTVTSVDQDRNPVPSVIKVEKRHNWARVRKETELPTAPHCDIMSS